MRCSYLRTIFSLVLFIVAGAARADIQISFDDGRLPDTGSIAVGVFAENELPSVVQSLDRAIGGTLTRAIAAAGFTGAKGEVVPILTPAQSSFRYVILVGLGPEDELSPVALQDFGGLAAKTADNLAIAELTLVTQAMNGLTDADAAANAALGARIGGYRFDKYRAADSPDRQILNQVTVFSGDKDAAEARYSTRFAAVATAVVGSRDLITEPANTIYPESFVARAREWFADLDNVEIEVLDVPLMEALGMEALLGVGRGSARPPRMLIVHYNGGDAGEAPVVFAGKGITFDAGGISLKENDGMWRMKYDMSGASIAIGAIRALAGRRARVNAVGIAALAENMPGGSAQRPGDVVRAMSGVTIEIMSTDAEGRLVLSDAVSYADSRLNPRIMVDVATLTGTVRRALGDEYAGLFSRHDDVAEELLNAGRLSGEELWRLPLHPSYGVDLHSEIADIKNSGVSNAGAGIGAYVIGTSVSEETRWAHLDIAGMGWRTESLPTVPIGASAFGIRLLDMLVERYYEAR